MKHITLELSDSTHDMSRQLPALRERTGHKGLPPSIDLAAEMAIIYYYLELKRQQDSLARITAAAAEHAKARQP